MSYQAAIGVFLLAILPLADACFATEVESATAQIDLEHVTDVLSEQIRSVMSDTGTPSIAIAVFNKERILWQQAFGYANVKHKVKATPETIYGTGSCLKPITAMAVMHLVDQGKVSLDKPIREYLPDMPAENLSFRGKPITARHLLGHYSGIANTFEVLPIWDRSSLRSLQEFATDLKATAEPGTRYEYSNAGFALAGFLVQTVSGMSFEQYLVDNLFRPVGVVVDRPIRPSGAMIEDLALPYRLENQQPVPERSHAFDVFPAGDAYLTATAMAKLLMLHLNEGQHEETRVLTPDSIQEMRRPQFGGKDGLDFGIRNHEGETLVMHGGGVPGYSTKFMLNIDAGFGVYVAANATQVQRSTDLIAQMAMDLLKGKELGAGLVQEIVGIGAVLELTPDKELKISDVLPLSPASRAGLTGGVIIAKINATPVQGKKINDCLKLLAGPTGSEVRLEIIASDKTSQVVVVKRQEFLMPG